MQDEGGDVPAHDENAQCHPYNGAAPDVYITQVFRREEQTIGAVGFHETAVDGTAKQVPEQEQHLYFPEMKNEQLNGEGMIDILQNPLHQNCVS